MMRRQWLMILWCGLMCSTARSQETNEKNLLQNGDFKTDLTNWTFQQTNAQAESVEAELPGDGKRYEQALRITINPSEELRPGDVSLSQPIVEAVNLNDRVQLKFWARADMPTRVEAFLFQIAPPNARRLDYLMEVGTEWKEVEMSGVLQQPLDAKTHQLVLHLAFAPTAIEITGLRLTKTPSAQDSEAGPPVKKQTGTVPDGATLLSSADFARGSEGWNTSPEASRYSVSIVPLKESVFSAAMRLTTKPRANDAPGKIWLRRDVPVEIKRGDKLMLTAWMRSRESVPINVLMENRRDSSAPKLMLKTKMALTPDWQQIEVRGIAAKDYPTGQLVMVFEPGPKPDVIDFAGVQIVKMP